MKKIISAITFALSVFIFISCHESGKSSQSATEQPTTADSIYATRHDSSSNSSFDGVYTGVLPCADCKGLDTEIAINKDNTYVKRTRHIGKSATIYGVKGTFTWNSEHTIILLSDIKEGPNQYLTGDYTLTQLDMAGKKITGNLADQYVLKK